MKTSLGSWLALVLMSVGCGSSQQAAAAFASDFECPNAVATQSGSLTSFRVQGCGRTATYVCQGTCTLEQEGAAKPSPSNATQGVTVTTGREVASATQEAGDGESTLRLDVTLDQNALLRLTATPETVKDVVQIKLIRFDATETNPCELDFMLDGQLVATPKSASSHHGRVTSHRVHLGRLLISDFEVAEKIGLRACKQRWALAPEQVRKVREFMGRFKEELAWSAPPRSGGTAGMLPPSGGWPEWQAPASPLPAAVDGPALDATALFKKLAVSVFKLEAKVADGVSQGSAVAVSPQELVTNCHVVQGALKLTLKQGKQEWPASVVRADPGHDRCTVTAVGATFQPVVGVRSYGSLEVGEAAYTLGSPVGLELTLSNGLISGKREEGGRNYIQTTAPISPGSSGGGLFDARGNLLGVTTLVLAGRERLNQSLNFAIPADSFGQTQ